MSLRKDLGTYCLFIKLYMSKLLKINRNVNEVYKSSFCFNDKCIKKLLF